MQISIPTASPVHLAQTGNCFPFQKKDLSGLQWHPNMIGIHLFIKPKNLSSKESNSNSNAAYKYPIQDRASNRDKRSDSGCFCRFWLIVFPYQEKIWPTIGIQHPRMPHYVIRREDTEESSFWDTPQCGQITALSSISCPQFLQNISISSFTVSQLAFRARCQFWASFFAHI